MKICVIGNSFLDCMGRPTAGHFNPRGRNVGEASFVRGGVGRNVAENLANAGADVMFFSSVDDSPFGGSIIEDLGKKGVDTSCMIQAKDALGMWIAVLDLEGEVAASVSKQPDYSVVEQAFAEKCEDMISGCGAVALDCDMTLDILKKTCYACEKLEKPLYVVVSHLEILLKEPELLEKMTVFICNNIEAGRIAGEDYTGYSNEELLEVIKSRKDVFKSKMTVVTTGANGVVWYNAVTGEGGTAPTKATDVKDSTGAGDSFFSGFVFAKTRGKTDREAIDCGLVFAAGTLEYIGPVRPDIKSCLED